uniref:Uncharacterized protein n=1 Tax=Auxenochlorella protothecoides TaxID=3075 RepID=A0A1D1ZWY3_AUXPR
MALISGSLHVAWRDAPHPHPFSPGLPQGLPPRRCRHPGRRPHTACSGTGGTQSRSMPLDAFQAAALRLQGLLVGVGNGEEELERSMLIAAPQELKLLIVTLAAAARTAAAVATCSVFHLPSVLIGSLNPNTAAEAATASVLLALVKTAAWRCEERGSAASPRLLPPVVAEACRARWRAGEAMYSGLRPAQRVLAGLAEGLSSTAATLAVAAALDSMAQELLARAPPGTAAALPLAMVAAWHGAAAYADVAPDEEEAAVVRDAAENAERYYRVVLPSWGHTPAEASRAFRAVAAAWLGHADEVARVAALSRALEAGYMLAAWRMTGSTLVAAAVAAAGVGVDLRCSLLAGKRRPLRRGGE